MDGKEGVFGIFAGTVVDADDPHRLFRARVSVPALGEEYERWATPCSAPDSRAVPARGQQVWVMFQGGDVNFPVWLGRPATDKDELAEQRHLLDGFEGSGGWEGTERPEESARDRRKRYLLYSGSCAVLLALLLFDWWIFSRLLGMSHVNWYLENGAVIALVTSVIATAWADVDTHVGLIAADPYVYVGANLQQAGIIIWAMSQIGIGDHHGKKIGLVVDTILINLWMLVVAGGLLVWFVVVVPVQYIVIVLSGAPARLAIRSKGRPILRTVGWHMTVHKAPKTDGIRQGLSEAGLFRKPVTSTNLLTAGLLLIITAFR